MPAAAAAHDARCGKGGDAGSRLYGTVTVGGLTLAIPISAIREVIPRPAALLPLPATREEVIGAITLRGATVPVLDGERLLGIASTGPCPIILILRDDDRVIGLSIATVAGVLPLGDDELTRLAGNADSGARSAMLQTAFARGESRGMVLDIAALAALPGMPLAVERRSIPARSEGAGRGIATLLFSAGSVRLGLAASVIEATVPEQAVTPSPIDDALWIGWLVHNGRRLPLVDTLRLLGLGKYGRSERAAAVIVRLSSGDQVGLRIDAVSDIRSLADRDVTSLQDFRVGNHALFKGLYDCDGSSLVLDPQAVSGDGALIEIGRVVEQQARAADPRQLGGADISSFLLVQLAGQRLAIPLDQVEEIIATRSSGIGLSDDAQAISDFIVHRGRGIPLINLHARLEMPVRPPTSSFTVIVSAAGNHAGFMVEELCAVERAVVQRSRVAGASRELGRVAATITTGGSTYSVLDLRELIAMLCSPAKAA